ncbi:MAG: ATP-binding cassette domain-containing protein, partial [Planctomycetes bacterium]|nr:ATP-binding cassette domain-containing protein [Planctomycetota bacterium]
MVGEGALRGRRRQTLGQHPQGARLAAEGLPAVTVSTPALAEVDVVFAGVDVRLGERTVLSGIDLRIARGQRVALIGPSGAGKTTLLRLCGGVLWPTRGSV